VLFIGARDSGDGTDAFEWTLQGTTDQAAPIKLRLDKGGRVLTFAVRVRQRCSGGTVRSVGWYPSVSGLPARFGSRGPAFDAVESGVKRQSGGVISTDIFNIRGRVAGGTHASGTVHAVSTYLWFDGRTQTCLSPTVHWQAASG
jgi:hypothetical protein